MQNIRNPFVHQSELYYQELDPLLSPSQQVNSNSRCAQEGLDCVNGTLRRGNACSPCNQRARKTSSRLLIDGLESTEGVSPMRLIYRRGGVEEIAGSLLTFGEK